MSLEESPVSALSHNESWPLRLVMALTGSVWQTNQFSAGTGRDDEPSEVRGKLAHAVLMGQAAGRGAISRARTQSQEDGPARRHGFALRIDYYYYYYYYYSQLTTQPNVRLHITR